jgi:hypothetical protein
LFSPNRSQTSSLDAGAINQSASQCSLGGLSYPVM